MPRGINEKVFYRIRYGTIHEDGDRAEALAYLEKLKAGKENKNAFIYSREVQYEGKQKGLEILILEKNDARGLEIAAERKMQKA